MPKRAANRRHGPGRSPAGRRPGGDRLDGEIAGTSGLHGRAPMNSSDDPVSQRRGRRAQFTSSTVGETPTLIRAVPNRDRFASGSRNLRLAWVKSISSEAATLPDPKRPRSPVRFIICQSSRTSGLTAGRDQAGRRSHVPAISPRAFTRPGKARQRRLPAGAAGMLAPDHLPADFLSSLAMTALGLLLTSLRSPRSRGKMFDLRRSP